MQLPEYSPTILIAAGAALLILGLLIGTLVGRRSSPAAQKQREAERKLDQLLQDKQTYEDEVVEHFSDTAKLLNNLTERYRDVHNHLAKGADTLCQGRGPVALGRLAEAGDDTEIPSHLADVRPPLDYAPKVSPNEQGMLAEEFGIERSKSGEPVPQVEKQTPPAAEPKKD